MAAAAAPRNSGLGPWPTHRLFGATGVARLLCFEHDLHILQLLAELLFSQRGGHPAEKWVGEGWCVGGCGGVEVGVDKCVHTRANRSSAHCSCMTATSTGRLAIHGADGWKISALHRSTLPRRSLKLEISEWVDLERGKVRLCQYPMEKLILTIRGRLAVRSRRRHGERLARGRARRLCW